jgi:hypothetical protein
MVAAEAWPPFPPSTDEIGAAAAAGGPARLANGYVLAPAREAAMLLDVEPGWSDGSGSSFWAIKHGEKHPTVVQLELSAISGHELWHVVSWVTLGACDEYRAAEE